MEACLFFCAWDGVGWKGEGGDWEREKEEVQFEGEMYY